MVAETMVNSSATNSNDSNDNIANNELENLKCQFISPTSVRVIFKNNGAVSGDSEDDPDDPNKGSVLSLNSVTSSSPSITSSSANLVLLEHRKKWGERKSRDNTMTVETPVTRSCPEGSQTFLQSLLSKTRGMVTSMSHLTLSNSSSVEITRRDPTYRVVYLGNVVTYWAKGEGCLERPASALWRNYQNTQNNRGSIRMSLHVCPSGLKANTREHGLTEYWANRLTYCGTPSDHPRLFCWIYRHEGRKLKQELRCHAVLVKSSALALKLTQGLRDRLSEALYDFKREKIIRQNCRLGLSSTLYSSTPSNLNRSLSSDLSDHPEGLRRSFDEPDSAPSRNKSSKSFVNSSSSLSTPSSASSTSLDELPTLSNGVPGSSGSSQSLESMPPSPYNSLGRPRKTTMVNSAPQTIPRANGEPPGTVYTYTQNAHNYKPPPNLQRSAPKLAQIDEVENEWLPEVEPPSGNSESSNGEMIGYFNEGLELDESEGCDNSNVFWNGDTAISSRNGASNEVDEVANEVFERSEVKNEVISKIQAQETRRSDLNATNLTRIHEKDYDFDSESPKMPTNPSKYEINDFKGDEIPEIADFDAKNPGKGQEIPQIARNLEFLDFALKSPPKSVLDPDFETQNSEFPVFSARNSTKICTDPGNVENGAKNQENSEKSDSLPENLKFSPENSPENLDFRHRKNLVNSDYDAKYPEEEIQDFSWKMSPNSEENGDFEVGISKNGDFGEKNLDFEAGNSKNGDLGRKNPDFWTTNGDELIHEKPRREFHCERVHSPSIETNSSPAPSTPSKAPSNVNKTLISLMPNSPENSCYNFVENSSPNGSPMSSTSNGNFQPLNNIIVNGQLQYQAHVPSNNQAKPHLVIYDNLCIDI